jgi:6-phospho-beta-glucosidase
VDTDSSRLTAVTAVLDHQRAGRAVEPFTVRATTDADEALYGAAVVFSAIRVGGLAGRIVDEQVARQEGVVGQETVGAGGISYGLRTVPVVRQLAERIAAAAPDAWVVNFTNPAGVVTEVMSMVLGERVIGICDSSVGLCRRAAGAVDADPDQAVFDYVGLNHLGWLRGISVDGRDLLPTLLSDQTACESFEEGALFGAGWLRTLGAIPNEYLHYYYFEREVRSAEAAAPSRGEVLAAQQAEFYSTTRRQPAIAHEIWGRGAQAREESYLAANRSAAESGPRSVAGLEGGGYTGVALAAMRALTRDEPTRLIVDTRNNGTVPGIAAEEVVEVPCVVDGHGAHPLPTKALTAHQSGLIHAVKACEAETISAALTGSRQAALRALAWHPLVDSVTVARRLLDGYLAAVPGLADVLDKQ